MLYCLVVYESGKGHVHCMRPGLTAGTRLRTLQKRTITSASMQAAWAFLADFGAVALWAPGMRRSRLVGDRRSGVGARRVLRHRWGFTVEECITGWEEGRGYAFELLKAPFPMRNVRENWRLDEADGRTAITTTVSYEMALGVFGSLLDHLVVKHVVAREMRSGLEGLRRHLERLASAQG